MSDKLILDPCCGSKMMHFNKNHPKVVYADIRSENHVLCDGRSLEVKPDFVADVTELPFENESFYLVVMDLPHLDKIGDGSWMKLKYGKLPTEWQPFIKKAFDECYRVLKTNGTLIFKWNEHQIPVNKIIELLGITPIFGHPTRHSKTIWLTFFKF